MRYFTYELISAANDWISQTECELRDAEQRYEFVAESYLLQLDTLENRISNGAFNFFRYGFGPTGLHDGRLMSLQVGDGLAYDPNGLSPFGLNRQRTSVIIEFLNNEQDFHYVFDLRGVSRLKSDLLVDQDKNVRNLGDLYTYELTDTGSPGMQLGFLFAAGSTIVVDFKKMVFRKRRIKQRYPIGEIYR